MNDNEVIEIAQKKLNDFGTGKWHRHNHPNVAEGSEFKFIALTTVLGFKFRAVYRNNPDCVKRTFSRQKLAFEKGVGPRPIKVLDFEFEGQNYSGYTTELATHVGEATGQDQYILEEKLHQLGMQEYAFDLFRWNMGKYKGQWVSIDFGDLSVR